MTIRRKLPYGETFNPSTPPRKCSAVYIAALLFILLSTFAAFPAAALALSGDGSEGDPYLISTADDLSKCGWDSDGHFKLIADIDLTNTAVEKTKWFQNTEFKGTFDGNGHTIKGLRITADHSNSQDHSNYDSDGNGSSTTNVTGYGLFPIIAKTGVVKNLILEEVNVDIEVSKAELSGFTRYHAAGAIAGINGGTIENCVVKSGSVKIYGGSRSGVNRVAGGVVGWNMKRVSQAYIKGDASDGNLLGLGKIINCINRASVEANGRRQRTGDILSAGGIAGKSEMAATSAKAAGNNLHVHATRIQGCANFGSVKTSGETGDAYAGGIAGSGESSTDIIFCFNAGAVASEEKRSGHAFIGGIIGSINANYCGSDLLWCANAGVISAKNDYDKGEIAGMFGNARNERPGSEIYSRVENCYWSNVGDGIGSISPDFRTVNIGKNPNMPVYIEAVPTGRATPDGYAGEVQLKIYYANGKEMTDETELSRYVEIVGKPAVSGVSANVTTSGQKITAQTSVESGTFSVTAKVKLKQNYANIYDHTVTAFFHAEEYVVPVGTLGVDKNDITLALSSDGTEVTEQLTASVTPYDPDNRGDQLADENKNIKWQVSGSCVNLSPATTQSGSPVTLTAVGAGTATITATTAGLDKDGNPLTETVSVTVYAANVDDTDKAIIDAIGGGTESGAQIPSGAQGGVGLLSPSKSDAETTFGSAGTDVVTAIVTNAAEALGVAAGNVAVAGTDESNMKIFSSQADSAGTDAYWRVTATAEFTSDELSAANIGDITKETVIVTLLVDTGNGWTPVTLTGLATPDSFTLNFTESGGVNVTVPAIVFDKAAAEGEAIVTPLATDSPHYLIMDGNADGTYKFAIAIAATIAPVETLTVTPEEISLTLGADDSAELTATVTVSDPNDKGLTPGAAGINWQASEDCITLSSTTTQSGDSITVTAQSAGTATITATTEGLDKEGKPLTKTVNVTVYGENVDETDKAIIDAIGGGTESGAQIPSGAQGGVGLLSPSKSDAETTFGSAGTDVVTAIVTNAAEALGVAAGNVAVAGTDESNMKIFSSQADSAGTDAYWRVTATAEFTSDELSAANIGDITKETVIVTLLVDTGNGTWEPVTLTGLATPDSFTLDFTEAGGVNVTVPAIVFDKAAQSGEAIVTPMTTPNADGTTTPHYLIMDGNADGTYKFAIAIAAADSTTQAASGITLDRTILTLAKDDSVQLKATVTPANAANKNVTWTSSDETVATVTQDGTVTAVAKEGTATVSAVSVQGGYTASCEVTVTDIRVVTKSESYEYITDATVYDPGTWPEEVTLVAAVSDKIDDAQKVLDNLLEHGKHDPDAIDGMTHAEPDSVSVLAAFTLSVEHTATSGGQLEIDMDLPTPIDVREGYYLYALIAPKAQSGTDGSGAMVFRSFPCTPDHGTGITSLKFTVDDYAAYFTDNQVYLVESKTVPPEQPTTPDSGGTSGGGGGGGCSAGFGALALLALAPMMLRRKK